MAHSIELVGWKYAGFVAKRIMNKHQTTRLRELPGTGIAFKAIATASATSGGPAAESTR